MTRRPASSSAPPRPLARASLLAGRTSRAGRFLSAVALRQRASSPPTAGLDELQRLHVDQVLVLADDVRLAHRLQKLLRALEVPQPDLDAAEPLGDMAVGARAGDDRVLPGEADSL